MKTILIVDDDNQYRGMLLEALDIKRFRLLSASNGSQALKIFREQTPDLVISDIIMPEKDGLEAIKEMKKIAPDVKIIAISGGGIGSAELYLDTARKFGADYTFQKPLIVYDLLYAVASLMQELPPTPGTV